MSAVKEFVKGIPVVGDLAKKVYNTIRPFPGSETFWEKRYAARGNSGIGSYNKFAEFKAETLNTYVDEKNIKSVIEFGCGDGNQLMYANYPQYIGFDVSQTAVEICGEKFAEDKAKSFRSLGSYAGETADLALSLDVIYHLVEDRVFEEHLRSLFKAATHSVIIYSSNSDENDGYENTHHVKHRNFTRWVEANIKGWSLDYKIPNKYPSRGDDTQGSFADFYIYTRAV